MTTVKGIRRQMRSSIHPLCESSSGVKGHLTDSPQKEVEKPAPGALRVLIISGNRYVRQRVMNALRMIVDCVVVGCCEPDERPMRKELAQRPDLAIYALQNGDDLRLATLIRDSGSELIMIGRNEEVCREAFDLDACDCLLLDFGDERLHRGIQRCKHLLQLKHTAREHAALLTTMRSSDPHHRVSPSVTPDASNSATIVVRSRGVAELIPAESIEWIEGCGPYVKLHTTEKTIIHRDRMSKLEDDLVDAGFVRVNRSAIVRKSRIREIRTLKKGSLGVVLADGMTLPVGTTYRERIRQLVSR